MPLTCEQTNRHLLHFVSYSTHVYVVSHWNQQHYTNISIRFMLKTFLQILADLLWAGAILFILLNSLCNGLSYLRSHKKLLYQNTYQMPAYQCPFDKYFSVIFQIHYGGVYGGLAVLGDFYYYFIGYLVG